MEIREIDPNDPVFRNLKQEGTPGRLNLTGKFAMPGFLQKREQVTYQPPAREKSLLSTLIIREENERQITAQPAPPEPAAVEPVKPQQAATLPQVRVRVPPLPPQIDSIGVSPPKHTFRHLPTPKPKEPLKLDPELEEMIKEGPPYTARPDPQPVSVASYAPDAMGSAAIYGTGQGGGFSLPSIRLPSFGRKKTVVDIEDVPHVREIAHPGWQEFIKQILPQFIVGVICVYFGLTSTGSYYQPATRFAGDIATVFYGYQLGTLIAIFGCFLAYDAFRKAGKV